MSNLKFYWFIPIYDKYINIFTDSNQLYLVDTRTPRCSKALGDVQHLSNRHGFGVFTIKIWNITNPKKDSVEQ